MHERPPGVVFEFPGLRGFRGGRALLHEVIHSSSFGREIEAAFGFVVRRDLGQCGFRGGTRELRHANEKRHEKKNRETHAPALTRNFLSRHDARFNPSEMLQAKQKAHTLAELAREWLLPA